MIGTEIDQCQNTSIWFMFNWICQTRDKNHQTQGATQLSKRLHTRIRAIYCVFMTPAFITVFIIIFIAYQYQFSMPSAKREPIMIFSLSDNAAKTAEFFFFFTISLVNSITLIWYCDHFRRSLSK